jgi:hypothetical protein
LLILKDLLDWDQPPHYYRENISKRRSSGREEITQEIRAIIQEKNQLDLELYAYATRRFSQALPAQDEGLQAQLAAFQQANRRYSARKRPQKILRDLYLSGRQVLKKK